MRFFFYAIRLQKELQNAFEEGAPILFHARGRLAQVPCHARRTNRERTRRVTGQLNIHADYLFLGRLGVLLRFHYLEKHNFRCTMASRNGRPLILQMLVFLIKCFMTYEFVEDARRIGFNSRQIERGAQRIEIPP